MEHIQINSRDGRTVSINEEQIATVEAIDGGLMLVMSNGRPIIVMNDTHGPMEVARLTDKFFGPRMLPEGPPQYV